MERKLERNCGVFNIFIEHSPQAEIRRPWIFSVASPSGRVEQGSARSRRRADRAIRRFVSLEEHRLLWEQREEKLRQDYTRILRRSGLEQREALHIASLRDIRCQELSPGHVLCSWRGGIRGEVWSAAIYIQGHRASATDSQKSRRRAERGARRGLQEFWEEETLRNLGQEHQKSRSRILR